jgi:hypothetical protein
MELEKLKNYVNGLNIAGKIKEIIYSISSVGQNYAIIINRLACLYVVRLILQIDSRLDNLISHNKITQTISIHLSFKEAKNRALSIEKGLSCRKVPVHPKFKNSIKYVQVKHLRQYLNISDEVRTNPDLFLKPGDHVSILRELLGIPSYAHEAIYIGDQKVIQVPNTKDPIHMADWPEFLSEKPHKISVCIYLLEMKERQSIIKKANELISTRGNEYNLIGRNCQHFSSYCATGVEFSNQVDIFFDISKKVLIGIFCSAIVGSSPFVFGKKKARIFQEDDWEFKNIFVPKKHKLYNHDVDPNIKIYF